VGQCLRHGGGAAGGWTRLAPASRPTHDGAGRSAALSVLGNRLGGLTWRFRRSLPGWCSLGGFQRIELGGHDAGNGRAQDKQQHVLYVGIEGLDTLHHGLRGRTLIGGRHRVTSARPIWSGHNGDDVPALEYHRIAVAWQLLA
jgi:hypothetical protein